LRLLLDTHALIWFFAGDERLPVGARNRIEDLDAVVLVSAVSAIEVTLKHRLGKLPQAGRLALDFEGVIERYGFVGLPISLAHAAAAGGLQIPHKDPFDRLLIAQSLLDGVPLVSNETAFDAFGVTRVW
jgi:PIN domain nuclease of toxin-antitoxin system